MGVAACLEGEMWDDVVPVTRSCPKAAVHAAKLPEALFVSCYETRLGDWAFEMRSGGLHSSARDPRQSPHRIHVGDICTLKDSDSKTGVIFRTHVDIYTHTPEPLAQYPRGIQKHSSIDRPAFDQFCTDGIPPPHTVLISWSHDFSLDFDDSETQLIAESLIVAIDRPMFVGDIVRRSADDSMSGTIVSTEVFTNLIEPRHWPAVGDTQAPSLSAARRLKDVPASALRDTLGFTTGQIIVYKGWVGQITEYWEAVSIRLSDGSVVEVEDPEDLDNPSFMGEDGATIGDFVTTKKGNLRRGRFIYGSYNPNTPPEGYVVQVSIQDIEVRWLQCHQPPSDDDDRPPPNLGRDELESPDLKIYDRTTPPSTSLHSAGISRIADIDVGVGDKVRFADPEDAKVKYADRVRFYPRTQTLGYDINVFTVYGVRTMATVQWQDLSRTTQHALELLPSVDLDDGIGVWPGELVFTKTAKDPKDTSTYEPEHLGIVQSVSARDRIARVRWFEGTATFAADDHEQILPGSWTGKLLGDDNDPKAGEDVSMYDLWTCSSLMRRVGDVVILTDDLVDDPAKLARSGPAQYADVADALKGSPDDLDWLGEVIELSIHGWILVRLGASNAVRDIRVPWEFCLLACGADDLDDPELDEELDADMDDPYFEGSSEDEEFYTRSANRETEPAPWMDDLDRPIDEVDGHDEWETDDEDAAMESPPAKDDTNVAGEPIDDMVTETADTRAVAPDEAPAESSSPKFSYEHMFPGATKIEPFAVLDGSPPDDHHYIDTTALEGDTKRLRRLQKEYNVLKSSLPAGVFARTWESNLSLLRILILGPLGTPYEYAPFVVDMHLDDAFPAEPPHAFFHSWTAGSGPVNPNLYEDGKICLSLLGTWPGGDAAAIWTPKSTILQVVVSLLGLVLVKEPWYNEAGYEVRAGTAESRTPAALYSERVFLKTRDFVETALDSDVGGLNDVLRALYLDGGKESPRLMRWACAHAVGVVLRSAAEPSTLDDGDAGDASERRTVSAGALLSLRRKVAALFRKFAPADEHGDEDGAWMHLRRLLDEGPAALRECPPAVVQLVRRAG